MPTFTPPTVNQGVSDPFWGRYSVPVGQSVVKKDGVYQLMPYPWLGDLIGDEGTDWFLGGRTYEVTDAVATALSSAGFTVEGDLGYGIGPYGQEGYGD
jgi:hypothetical protein